MHLPSLFMALSLAAFSLAPVVKGIGGIHTQLCNKVRISIKCPNQQHCAIRSRPEIHKQDGCLAACYSICLIQTFLHNFGDGGKRRRWRSISMWAFQKHGDLSPFLFILVSIRICALDRLSMPHIILVFHLIHNAVLFDIFCEIWWQMRRGKCNLQRHEIVASTTISLPSFTCTTETTMSCLVVASPSLRLRPRASSSQISESSAINHR